ncbi:hypothetical protein EB796_022498 [Bugula neritina]|uniref:Uncharacterized protein n=1 Tax=Bugula neritina TaxID=10212 RepID=A0A7J7IZH8_BUGNE|nr:hypothetical protein EB796_022498 [Bugula neritina]
MSKRISTVTSSNLKASSRTPTPCSETDVIEESIVRLPSPKEMAFETPENILSEKLPFVSSAEGEKSVEVQDSKAGKGKANALKRRMQNAKEFGDELEKSQSFEEDSDVSEEKPVTPVLSNGSASKASIVSKKETSCEESKMHLMMHMEIFHVKCFQMQLFCGTCCRGESQHGLMTELNEQEPIKCLIADAEMEDDAEIPEEIVTISSKTAKPLELSHALNDVRSDKRVTSARVGRLRPLRKLSNDVKFEDDSEVLEEIMDISPKAAKPVELSPVSNDVRSNKRIASARVGKLRPLKELTNDVELENDAEILEEIMDISPKTAKPVELSPVSKGVKSNKRVASAKGSKLRPLKKLPNRVKFEDNSEIIEEIMDISPKATKPLALSPVSNDARSNKRVASARVGRLRPLRKLANDVELEDDAEIFEEIMDISPKAAKPVELSPVSNDVKSNKRIASARVGRLRPLKELSNDVEVEEDTEIPEEIVNISSKTAKSLELSHVSKGVS